MTDLQMVQETEL